VYNIIIPDPHYCTTCATNTLGVVEPFGSVRYDIFLVQKKTKMQINIQICIINDQVDVWIDWDRNGVFQGVNNEHLYINANFSQYDGIDPILNFEASIPNDILFSNPSIEIWMRLILGDAVNTNSVCTDNLCLNQFQYGDIKDIQISSSGTSSGGYQDPHLQYPKKDRKGETIIDIPHFEHNEHNHGWYNIFPRNT